jgi:hypothetical protein
MNTHATQHKRPATSHLHPRVYLAIAGLTVLYVLSVWYGFASGRYTDYLLVVVTGFIALSVGLTYLAWRVRQKSVRPGSSRKSSEDFRDWAKSDVVIGQERMKGYAATIEILLPIAAIAFGMMAFAVVAHLAG